MAVVLIILVALGYMAFCLFAPRHGRLADLGRIGVTLILVAIVVLSVPLGLPAVGFLGLIPVFLVCRAWWPDGNARS